MLKVIIADDDELFTEYMRKCIDWRSLDASVIQTASNGFEALRLVSEYCPEIIILDVEMPGMDGIECTGKIREAHPNCEILLITGHDEFQYAQAAAKFGVTDILLKPVDKLTLESALAHVINEYWIKYCAELVMKCYLDAENGYERMEKALTEMDSGNSLPVLFRAVAEAIKTGADINNTISRYLSVVENSHSPYNRQLWLNVYPAYAAAGLLAARGISRFPEPFEDQHSLLEIIQHAFSQGTLSRTLCEFCSAVFQCLSQQDSPCPASIAALAVDTMYQHYADPNFNIQTLAEMLHFHEVYLRRIFRSTFGKSPSTFLKDIRMSEAKRLLNAGDIQVQQIAQKVGFNDAAYFSKCFRQYYGYPPSLHK